MSAQDDVKQQLAKLAATFGTVQRNRETLKPGTVLEVTRDLRNPHAMTAGDVPAESDFTFSLVVVAEIQPEFVTSYYTQRGGTKLRVMRFEERVQVLDTHGFPHLLSEYVTWKVFGPDADA